MKSYCSRKQLLNSSHMDASNRLSLQACMGFFQDLATEHAVPLGWEHSYFLAKSNAFWVVTKIKLHINKMPTVADTVTLKTWMAKPTAVKFERDCRISMDKQSLVDAKTEWVVLDAETRRPRGVKTIDYPDDIKYLPHRAIEERFEQFALGENATKVLSRPVFYGDTDLNGHTNNCVYSRFVLDCFDGQLLSSHKLSDYEIHFVNQSYLGEVLDFYKTDDGNVSIVEARVGDKIIVRAKLTFAEA